MTELSAGALWYLGLHKCLDDLCTYTHGLHTVHPHLLWAFPVLLGKAQCLGNLGSIPLRDLYLCA